jgi:hypothetical protein
MKVVLVLLIALAAVLPAGAGERVIMYAMLTEALRVDLTDGSQWQMDKGDCFPVVAYKESHTKVILQLAGAQFRVPADKTRIVAAKEMEEAVKSYRENVNTYIASASDKWKDKAKDPNKDPDKAE